MNLKELEQVQLGLAKKVVKKDVIQKLELVSGIETGFKFNKSFCCVVVCAYNDMQVLETHSMIEECELAYIPNFRAQRELDIMVKTYNKLKQKPDILLVNASGIMHPRSLGLASHLGVVLDIATIGITKKPLCGKVQGEVIILDDEVVGKQVFTKEKAKPLFVSIGHKLSLDKSVEIVKKCIKPPHKMPEPLHIAHRIVKKNMKYV
ncbi:hypothetical protein AYK26_03470 [Euryarchaeota archaeon SM23-78]|nr:MAG: hypothetical protein AYK26_03470 [Euryarchaeota archaeon SM23-78]MBW3001079.1 endonuclease V [Candidatus Woesearchaeota archaeon]